MPTTLRVVHQFRVAGASVKKLEDMGFIARADGNSILVLPTNARPFTGRDVRALGLPSNSYSQFGMREQVAEFLGEGKPKPLFG